MIIDFKQFHSLISVVRYFNSEDICRQAIIDSRWSNGDYICPRCGKHHCVRCIDGKHFYCSECNRKFSATVGTIFDNTKISLQKWFMVMYLMSSHKKGISSCQVARDIETTQKTAWYMLQKIRTLFVQDKDEMYKDEVEMDEMYLGGRETNKHESKKVAHSQGGANKQPIFGMAQRMEGYNTVKAMKVDNTQAKTLMPIIKRYVEENSHLFTDESSIYRQLEKEGYIHDIVCHSAKQFAYDYNDCDEDGNDVKVNVTTNIIEGFWAHFKRMIFGIYHFCSRKYLQRYIDEEVYRWNTRKASQEERFSHMFAMSIGIVRYWDVERCA